MVNERRPHPDWNELAVLAESSPDSVRVETLVHLAVCPECTAAWSEAVQKRDRLLAEQAQSAPDARSFASEYIALRGRRIRGRRQRQFAGFAGLAAAAALILVVLTGGPDQFDRDNPRDLVEMQLSALSHEGLVYPGVDDLGVGSATRYRDGGHRDSGVDLTTWADRFATDPTDTGVAYWLAAGYLADGRLRFAEDVLRQALAHDARPARLRHLEAITAYRQNDLEHAERTLRTILTDRPDDYLASFNLSVILVETGRSAEARPHLERLANDDINPALQGRASELLSNINPQ